VGLDPSMKTGNKASPPKLNRGGDRGGGAITHGGEERSVWESIK